MTAKHVFVSYCHEDKAQVGRLVNDLQARGEVVWWDAKLKKGDPIDATVGRALHESYAAILCVSSSSSRRRTSGIYPEYSKAIAAAQKYAPGESYLFVVRLDECEVPYIEIDSNRALPGLIHTDYLQTQTEVQRNEEIDKLVEALRATQRHPH